MAQDGNPASVSDAGVGALCAGAAIRSAWLNVRINLPGLGDPSAVASLLQEGERLERVSRDRERAVLEIVERKMGKT
jgi:glutamate formiminotransferase/formiminotetrahydrofolate cyclodeaminase